MKLAITACALICAATTAAAAPAKLEDLARPPADALAFSIVSTAGIHGHSFRWKVADGSWMGRESLNLRGQIFEVDSRAHLGADGMIDHLAVRGFTPQGDAAETFDIAGGSASWKSPVDGASAAYTAPAEYIAFGGPIDPLADFVEALAAAPGRSLALLPGGQAHAEPLTTLDVGRGETRQTIAAYAVTGLNNTPVVIWLDAKGRFFAVDQGLLWVRAGYEGEETAIEKAQDGAMAARSPAIAKNLAKNPAGPIAFTHVRAFVGGDHFAEDETVVVDKGVITAAGPAASTPAPAGAQIVDGAGKTLVPGLWDSHQHVGDDSSGPLLLSLGITSARDPGNNNALTIARAQRRAKGELLMPHVYPSVLIDGKGPYTAQLGSVATSQDEALAIVRKAKADGFVAIKFYGTFNPALVKATAAEAHRLGLHVHGHLPAGMRPTEAIADGYDEITHIYFVAMQAMPDAVVTKSNSIARMAGPARYAKDMDLNAEPMKSLIAEMAARKITSDPTLVVVESLMVPENGELSAAYAPFVGTLPPTVERGFRQGGLEVAPDLTRAHYRESFAKLVALVGAMHKAGVPIVAGTDGTGMELVRELELYVQAGFTPSEALASATLATAHLVGADGHTGSIAVGKDADLVLVEGDPSHDIGDLRHTRMVLMDGKVMDADALRAAGGLSARPKWAD
ncbi:amidohydrolase family protein [Phenylobacterium montanum]|uniref:Amidohydrolase family protein n=1 Tax=Phenylobacterium montanum TaxID=2823693 RepID=A0A975IYH7_9CAUL|nr:amidohydrolase family protein [Caulobacter sp. S6]QUD90466.1 amidohydrolase family protein [Caulobacter sp. S6]